MSQHSITRYIKRLWFGSSVSPTKSVKQGIILSLPFKHKILPSLHYLSGSWVSSKPERGTSLFLPSSLEKNSLHHKHSYQQARGQWRLRITTAVSSIMTWVLSEKTTGLGQHSHSYSLNTSLQLKMFPDFGHLQRCSEVLRKEELLHRMLTEQLALEIRIFFNGKLFSSVQKINTYSHKASL